MSQQVYFLVLARRRRPPCCNLPTSFCQSLRHARITQPQRQDGDFDGRAMGLAAKRACARRVAMNVYEMLLQDSMMQAWHEW